MEIFFIPTVDKYALHVKCISTSSIEAERRQDKSNKKAQLPYIEHLSVVWPAHQYKVSLDKSAAALLSGSSKDNAALV